MVLIQLFPTKAPPKQPSKNPTNQPSKNPSKAPLTQGPTKSPSISHSQPHQHYISQFGEFLYLLQYDIIHLSTLNWLLLHYDLYGTYSVIPNQGFVQTAF
jgi:hypothetical protein